MDVRLDSLPFEFEGRHYTLRCNMNVLADVQIAYNGDLSPALNDRGTLRSVLEFLAAMMNDWADEQGWFEPGVSEQGFPCAPELAKRFTSRSLGRKLRREQIPVKEIFMLVGAALVPQNGKTEGQPQQDGSRGN